MQRIFFALFLTTCLVQQAGAKASKNDLGLGLDSVRWGMTSSQVLAALPGTRRAVASPFAITSPSFMNRDNYNFGGCRFTTQFVFNEQGKLHDITLMSVNRGCKFSSLLSELQKQYGKPLIKRDNSLPGKTSVIYRWDGPVIEASLMEDESIYVGFHRAGTSIPPIIDMIVPR